MRSAHPTLCSINMAAHVVLFVVIVKRCDGDIEIFEEEIQGVKFGSLSLLHQGSLTTTSAESLASQYRYILEDKREPGSLFVVDQCAIYSFSISSKMMTLIAGSKTVCGSRDGSGSSSRFRNIEGIIVSPLSISHLWVLDAGNHCIKDVDLNTQTVKRFAGVCGVQGNSDGMARATYMGQPKAITQNPLNPEELYIYDNEYYALIRLYLDAVTNNWNTEEVTTWTQPIQGLSFDLSGTHLYLAHTSGLSRVKVHSNFSIEDLIAGNGLGNNDGPLAEASVYNAGHMTFLHNDVFVMIDSSNSKLRVVNLQTGTISSICLVQTRDPYEFSPGNIDTCKIAKPTSILNMTPVADSGGKSLVISSYSAVYQVPYTGEIQSLKVEITTSSSFSSFAKNFPVGRWLMENKMALLYSTVGIAAFGCMTVALYLLNKQSKDKDSTGKSRKSKRSSRSKKSKKSLKSQSSRGSAKSRRSIPKSRYNTR